MTSAYWKIYLSIEDKVGGKVVARRLVEYKVLALKGVRIGGRYGKQR